LARFIWTEDNVKSVLVDLNNKGILTLKYLEQNYVGLLGACRRKFGSLKHVLDQLNIDYEELRAYNVWNKEKISSKLVQLYEEGVLTTSYLHECNGELLTACMRHFGSLENALEAVNIPYDEVRKTKRWNKEKVDITLLEALNTGNFTPSKLRQENLSLLGAAKRYYGSLENAVNSLGFSYEEITQNEKWSKKKISTLLKDRRENGLSLKSVDVKNDHPALHGACIKYFENYIKALEDTGLIIEEVYDNEVWEQDKVLIKLKNIGVEGILSYTNIALEERSLYKAAYHYFGSFLNACKEAGLDSNKIIEERPYFEKRHWTAEDVQEELKKFFLELGKAPYELRKEKVALEKATRDHFGTLKDALKSIGIDYESMWQPTYKTGGLRFEGIVKEIMSELYTIVSYRKKLGNCVPDIVLLEDIWVDAKLSEWTQSIPTTIDKYLPHCDQLWIVYLYGGSEEKSFENGKLYYTPISKVISRLPLEKQQLYIEKIEELKNWIDN